MLRLLFVTINRFMDFSPGTHLTFREGENFIVGFTGTGKNTLLRLLANLANLDPSISEILDSDQNSGLTWAWGLTYPDGTRATLELDLEASPDRQVRGSSIFTLTGRIRDRFGNQVFDFQFGNAKDVSVRWLNPETSLFVEGTRPKRGLSELLEWFSNINESNPRFELSNSGHSFVLSESTFDQITDPRGKCFVKAPKSQEPTVSGIPEELVKALLESDGKPTNQGNLKLNTDICRALGARSVEFVPRSPEVGRDGTRIWNGFDVFTSWKDGSMHRHEKLSKGQKRVIAHYWASALSPGMPYFAEDMAGSHSSQFTLARAGLVGRQTFHVVRNPSFLEGVGGDTGVILCKTLYSPTKCWTAFVTHNAYTKLMGY